MKSIREILTGKPVVSVAEHETTFAAAGAMAREHVGAVLVTGRGGAPRGIFTERDLMVRVIVPQKDPHRVRVGDVMTAELFTASADDPVHEVAQEMQRRHIRHLPVRDERGIVSMLSFRDLLRAHLEAVDGEKRALQQYIQGEA